VTGRHRYRRVVNNVMLGGAVACAGLCISILVFILVYIFIKGAGAIDVDFFIRIPKPLGESGGGVSNAIVGTIVMVGIATVIAVPVGIGAGVLLSEFAAPRLAGILRFTADVMTGFPSIVVGLFIYLVIVIRMGHFSGWAGGLAYAVIMLPILTRSSEEMLKLVPNSQREAAFALGVPRWRTIVSIVIPGARRGILTGVVLAVARAAGESAPLLFTSLGSRFLTTNPSQPMDALPLRIYRYATGPYNEWHAQAWASALVLVVFVLIFSTGARFLLGRESTTSR
jgi:phosphate transport system permease protein